MNTCTALPTLQIAIPCYRRPALLYRLLQSISHAHLFEQVKVVIVDDSPECANKPIFIKGLALGLDLHYIHNPDRLGIDANIYKCMQFKNTDYVWLMGEDDLVTNDSISNIMLELKSSPNLIFANYSQLSDNGTHTLRDLTYASLPTDKQDFVDKLLIDFGFLGSVVVKTAIMPSSNFLELGTFFSHIGSIISIVDLSDFAQLRVLISPCSVNRVGGIDAFSWEADAMKVYTGFSRLLSYIARECPPSTFSLRNSISRSRSTFYPLYKFTRVIRLKSCGLLSFREAYRLYRHHGGSLFGLLAALTPRPLAQLLTQSAIRILPKYRIFS